MNDELERLRERCAAYKGQVEAGAAEIERLRAALTKIREWDQLYEAIPDKLVRMMNEALNEQ